MSQCQYQEARQWATHGSGWLNSSLTFAFWRTLEPERISVTRNAQGQLCWRGKTNNSVRHFIGILDDNTIPIVVQEINAIKRGLKEGK